MRAGRISSWIDPTKRSSALGRLRRCQTSSKWWTPFRRMRAPTKRATNLSGGEGEGEKRSVSTPRWWRKSFSGAMPASRKVSSAFSERTRMRSARSYSLTTCWRVMRRRFFQPCHPRAAARSRSLLVKRSGLDLPLCRCQVGISMTLGTPCRWASVKDRRHSPDQVWKRS